MVQTANEIYRDFVTDGVPSSGEWEPKKSEIRPWGTRLENLYSAAQAGGGLAYETKAAMDADLAHDANQIAWVMEDPTAANNGIYAKVGASGSGSWNRLGDLPYSYIKASNAGAGTANAIVATTSIPIPSTDGGALIALPIVATNGASPVTVSFNGGAALTVKTSSGNDVSVGGLTAGMIAAGYVSGSTFRLLSDQAGAAIVAAAEAAADRAEAAVPNVFPATHAALKAVDPAVNSVAYLIEPGREGQFIWNSSDLSTFVAADTAEGIYVAPTSDATGASGAWIRQHEGEFRPEWFGATPITDWAAPADSTAALAGWASLINTLSAPFKTVLSGFYKSTAAIVLTASTLSIEATEAGQAGFFFDNTNGLSLTQSRRYDGFTLTGVAFITNANNLYTGFSYSGAANTGDSVVRTLDRCSWFGLDRYRNGKEGLATSNLNGWLTEISADQGDRLLVQHPVIFGAEDDRITGFDEDTAGVYGVDSTHLILEFPWIFFKKTAVKLRGQSENLEVQGGALVANYDGIDCQHDTSPANDHNIIGVHIASFNCDINIGVGGTITTTTMHNISGCLLFTRLSTETISAGFTFVKTNAACQITDNYLFVSAGLDSVAGGYVGFDIQAGKGSVLSGNVANRLGTVVKIGASAFHTVVNGNITSDDAGTLAVAPVIDAGTSTYIGPNLGDRTSAWPSVSFANAMWAKGGVAEFLGGNTGLTLFTATAAAGAVNYLDLLPGAAGTPAILRALGSDTAVDLELLPKGGAGRVRFGTLTASADAAVTGYIEIKDAGGTTRKLAVIS